MKYSSTPISAHSARPSRHIHHATLPSPRARGRAQGRGRARELSSLSKSFAKASGRGKGNLGELDTWVGGYGRESYRDGKKELVRVKVSRDGESEVKVVELD